MPVWVCMYTYVGAKLAILIPSHCLLLFSGLHGVHLGSLFSSRVPVWWVVLESHHLRGESLTFLRPRGSEVPPEGDAAVLGRLWCLRCGQDLASGLSTAFG